MAISPPGDIVLDVLRAADPSAVDAARERLAGFANAAGTATAFSVDRAAPAASRPGDARTPEAFTRFEAAVLQTFVQTMLPDDAEGFYGKGFAGDMWKSMLAEQLADAVARRGGVGISERILRDYYMEGDRKVSLQGVSHDPAKPEIARQEMLSAALVQEIQRRMARSLAEDGHGATSAPRAA